LQVKLTGTLGLLSEAWRTIAFEFQCVDFCVNTSFDTLGGPDDIIVSFPTEMFEQAMKQAIINWTNNLANTANNTVKCADAGKIVHQFDYHISQPMAFQHQISA